MAISIAQFRERVKQYAREPARIESVVKAFKKATSRARSATRRDIKRTSLGKKLWARGKKGGPKLSIGKAKITREGKGLVSQFTVKGMAAIIEQGGKTAAHTIKARSGGGLSFPGTNAFAGRIIKAEEVRHPGSIVRREESIKPAVERALETFEGELAQAMETHANRTF